MIPTLPFVEPASAALVCTAPNARTSTRARRRRERWMLDCRRRRIIGGLLSRVTIALVHRVLGCLFGVNAHGPQVLGASPPDPQNQRIKRSNARRIDHKPDRTPRTWLAKGL